MHGIHNNIVHEVSEGMQGVSQTTSKDYVTIQQAIKYTIAWAHKGWVKLMQLVQLVLPEGWRHLLLTTRMVQNQR